MLFSFPAKRSLCVKPSQGQVHCPMKGYPDSRKFFFRGNWNPRNFSCVILLHEKFLQFDWLRAVVFQLNLKYLHVKITKLLLVAV